ncbi:unnamed protein product [Mytilus edulis]|uniref:Uncharacterized protein n=1 Tax=Mytilus edulis TaxID=6550 RepID=A0A8S3RS59_MYTED|nr:unnamed protein product [Mytilus edulis]
MTPILENNDYHDYKRVVHINLECKYIFGVQKPFELFCCDDLQEKLGICKECYPGFKSRRKKYEYRCMNWRCICKDNQRKEKRSSCHNEHGCIDVKPLYTEVDSKHDGFTPLTLTNEQSAPTPVAATTSLTNESLGMVKTEIFIYSLFGVGTFFILCFIIGLCVYKKSHKENINSNSETIPKYRCYQSHIRRIQ